MAHDHSWISQTKEKILLWWLVVVWFLLFSISSLCTAIVGALYGMRWNEIEFQDKFVVSLIIFVNWSTTMMAFFSKAVSRVQKGELPLESGDTQLISKTTVETKTTATKD